MGICNSKTAEQLESERIEAKMRKEAREKQSIIKLLLLGAGESGKSTLFKQMKILYTEAQGFSKSERLGYVSVVHSNIIFNMQELIKGCDTHTAANNQSLAKEILAMDTKKTVINGDIGAMLKDIWNDGGVQDTWMHRSTIQVQDALEFYMKKIDTIASDDYSPDNQDILRTRVRTSGIVEDEFNINGSKINMYDVGGQRNERRKWMHKFDDVSAVIYVAAISEYDQLLFEDNTTNRQQESLQLFEEVYTSEWFKHLNFILFLNKEDLFIEKLPMFPFRVDDGPLKRNTDFEGPHCIPGEASSTPGTPEFKECVDAAEGYIKSLYEDIHAKTGKKATLYVHITDATNSENMNTIMNAVKDMVLRDNLERTGFISN